MSSQPYVSVRSVMTERPMLIDGLATVREAVEAMHRHGVSSLIINKRHDGDEYGILVVTDIAKKVVSEDRSPDRTNVYEVMSKPVLTVQADMNIRYAVRMLQQFTLSRALVLDGNELVGIVTLRDLVMAYLRGLPDDAGADATGEGVES